MTKDIYAERVASYYSKDIALNDAAHDMYHCSNVHKRMLAMNDKLGLGVDSRLIALAAFMHDLKVHIDRKKHHILAVKYILLNSDIDPFLNKLTEYELIMLMDAIISHRASINSAHTSKLSELLYAADKDEPDLTTIVLRSLEYSNHDADKVLYHMHDKFAREGYVEYSELYIKYYGTEQIEKLYKEIEALTLADIERISVEGYNI